VDQEGERTAVARVLNLADGLELLVDRLDDRPLAQEQLVRERHHAEAPGHAQARAELDALLDQHLLGQGLRNGACVGEELAEAGADAAEQRGEGLAVSDVASGEAEGEQLAALRVTTRCRLKP
jgi:hypothetical protein